MYTVFLLTSSKRWVRNNHNNDSKMEKSKRNISTETSCGNVAYSEYGEYSDDSGKILIEIMDNPESESEGSDVELDWLKK